MSRRYPANRGLLQGRLPRAGTFPLVALGGVLVGLALARSFGFRCPEGFGRFILWCTHTPAHFPLFLGFFRTIKARGQFSAQTQKQSLIYHYMSFLTLVEDNFVCLDVVCLGRR